MSQYGEHLHLTIFGQSHAPAIGMTPVSYTHLTLPTNSIV